MDGRSTPQPEWTGNPRPRSRKLQSNVGWIALPSIIRLASLFAIACLTTACGKQPSRGPAPSNDEAVSITPTASAPVSASASASPPRVAFTACGAFECRVYDDLASAFEATLADKPLVLAVGEAHAKKGFEEIDSSARLFTRELLPRLQGRASELILELMAPAQGCAKVNQGTSERLAKISENQSDGIGDEYVALGEAAKKIGVEVEQLHPSCKELATIATSKTPGLTGMRTITALISREATRILAAKTNDTMLVIYGGAFHTEPDPPAERSELSFAASVSAAAKGRYVSVHLFVREYINPSWGLWEWYPSFEPNQHLDKVLLLHPEPHHYVIIAPGTSGAKPHE